MQTIKWFLVGVFVSILLTTALIVVSEETVNDASILKDLPEVCTTVSRCNWAIKKYRYVIKNQELLLNRASEWHAGKLAAIEILQKQLDECRKERHEKSN